MASLSAQAESSLWVAPASASHPSPVYSTPLPFLHQHLITLITPPSSPSPSSPPPPASPSASLTPTSSFHIAQHLLAGGIAGSIARTVVAPLDRVKMLMQTQFLLHKPSPVSTTSPIPTPMPITTPRPTPLPLRTLGLAFPISLLPSLPSTPPPPHLKYHQLLPSLRLIIAEEGVAKLWKGNLLNISRVFPYSAIQFSSYDAYKRLIRRSPSRAGGGDGGRLNAGERLTAGALAGMTATSLTHPMDVVRLRLSIHRELTGVTDAFLHVWQEGGARALFKGFIPTMWSVSPFIAINFASFDLLKQRVQVHSTLNILLLGAASGLLAQSVCYPLDTVRRRQQMKGRHYAGMLDAFQRIAQVEGIRGFYRGMVPNAIKVVPNNAIRFVVFEAVKKQLGLAGTGSGGGGM